MLRALERTHEWYRLQTKIVTSPELTSVYLDKLEHVLVLVEGVPFANLKFPTKHDPRNNQAPEVHTLIFFLGEGWREYMRELDSCN